MKIRSSKTWSLVLLAAIGSLAHAQTPGWYFGGGVGQSRATVDADGIRQGLLNGGITTSGGLNTTSVTSSTNDSAYKLNVGYQFNPYIALEGGYADLGAINFQANTTPAGTFSGTRRSNAAHADVLAFWPLTQAVSLYGRAGLVYGTVQESYSASGAVQLLRTSYNKTEGGTKAGVGLQYAVSPKWSARLEYEQYQLKAPIDQHMNDDVFSVSVVYYLGRGVSGASQ